METDPNFASIVAAIEKAAASSATSRST